MKEITFDEHAKEVLQILQKGAFLTTHADGKTNTMTIGWGYLGYSWRKPVFGVMVRHNRYTHQLLDKNPQFTITLPKEDLSKELAFCGTKCGADTDKIPMIKTTTKSSIKVKPCPLRVDLFFNGLNIVSDMFFILFLLDLI